MTLPIDNSNTYKKYVVQVAKSESPKSNYRDHYTFQTWQGAQKELRSLRKSNPRIRSRILVQTFISIHKLAKVEVLK